MLFELNNARGDFFIQLKGNNAGKPMRNKTANSIGVIVNQDFFLPEFFYYTMLSIYMSGIYQNYIKGSVIPYIRHEDIITAVLDYYTFKGR